MGLNSAVSNRLNDVRRQLMSGRTRGSAPRDLAPEEITKLEQKRDELEAELLQSTQMRLKARLNTARRINCHTTAEVDRGVKEIKEEVGRGVKEMGRQWLRGLSTASPFSR